VLEKARQVKLAAVTVAHSAKSDLFISEQLCEITPPATSTMKPVSVNGKAKSQDLYAVLTVGSRCQKSFF